MPFSISKPAPFLSALLMLGVLVSTFANVFFLPPIPKAQADTTTGLVGHWTFDNTLNDSAGINHGTFNGGTPNYQTGKVGQALLFDGVDDYVNCGTSSIFDLTSQATVSAWFNANVIPATNSSDFIFAKTSVHTASNDKVAYGLDLRQNSASFDISSTNVGGNNNTITTAAGNTGEWHHAVGVMDASSISIYIDGVLKSSVSRTETPYTGGWCIIGSSVGTAGAFAGLIDDVRMYNRALSGADVTQLYNLGASAPAPTVSLSASPTSIASGQSSTLTWSSSNATSCSASNGWSGTKATGGPHSQSVSPTQTTTYTFTCTGDGGSTSQSTTVTVTSTTDTTPPSTPTLAIPSVISSSQINLSWTAATDNESTIQNYKLYWCSGSTSCVPSTVITLGNTTSYSHTGLTANTTYRYQVAAMNSAELEGGKSAIQTATTQSSSSGNTFYVATTGNDANPGTSAQPFRTIQKAADIVNPGDTVIVRDGTYSQRDANDRIVFIQRGGTSAAPVTFRSENQYGAKIDGQDVASQGFMVAASWVIIDGFEIYDIVDTGVKSWNSNLTIQNNKIYQVGENCIFHGLGGNAISILNNDVSVCGNMNDTGHAMYIETDNAVVIGNVIHDINRYGIHCYRSGTDNCDNGTFAYNEIYAFGLSPTSSAGGITCDGSGNKIFNNVIHSTFYNGPSAERGIQISYTCNGAVVYNNTVTGVPVGLYVDGSVSDTIIRNNIAYDNALANIENNGTNTTFSNNLCNAISGGCTHSGNPSFVSAGSDDYHILSNSAARNAGFDLSGTVNDDFDGILRPQESVYDIGAYEFAGSGGSDTTPPSPPVFNTPSVVSSSRLDLSWSASSDASGIANYELYRCQGSSCTPTTLIASPTGTSYGDSSGLSASTAYSYRVRAKDNTGNLSSYSNTVTATTQSSSSGATYYVATTGNDANPGTSAQPFRTIQKAANVVNPGDTVIVRDGIYTDTDGNGIVVYVTRGGTSGNIVTFRSENQYGAKIDGSNGTTEKGWHISAPYIRIEGFEIANIRNFAAQADHGIISFTSNIQIVGNNIHNIGRRCTDSPYGMDGIFLGQGVSGWTIEKNIFHDIGRFAQGEQGCSYDATVTHWQNGDHGIYLAGANNIHIKNNIFYKHEHGWAIHVYNGSSSTGSSNISILNNTFAFPNPWREGHIVLARPGISNSRIMNNIFYQPTTAGVRLTDTNFSGNVISYNVTDMANIATSQPSGISFSNNVTSTQPQFVNTTTNDFHLRSTSPAIDAGTTLSEVSADFNGVSRPQGSAYDIGAYEFAGSTAPAPSVTINKTSYAAGETIAVTVNGGLGGLQEWVAMYVASNPDSAFSACTSCWQYLNGTQTQPSSAPTYPVILTFTAPATAGTYNIRYFRENGTANRLAISGDYTVTELANSPFAVNDRIQINSGGSTVNVRSCASTSCSIVGTQGDRALGTVISATPTTADGFTWHQVDFASGVDGYVAESFLVFAGDLNRDATVNSLDWSSMNSVWFQNNTTADINKDGIVNSIDFGILNRNWGKSS